MRTTIVLLTVALAAPVLPDSFSLLVIERSLGK